MSDLTRQAIEADPVRAMTGDEIRELIAENELMLENICDLETRCVAKAAEIERLLTNWHRLKME